MQEGNFSKTALTRPLLIYALIGLILVVGAMAYLPSTPVRAATTWNVSISNFQFTPATTTINVGDTVTWTVTGGPHTTTSDPGQTVSWDSGSLSDGKSFSFTFNTAGNFTYHCAIHPSMHGTVMVQQPVPEFPGLAMWFALAASAAVAVVLSRKFQLVK
jgi:plastocyanin